MARLVADASHGESRAPLVTKLARFQGPLVTETLRGLVANPALGELAKRYLGWKRRR